MRQWACRLWYNTPALKGHCTDSNPDSVHARHERDGIKWTLSSRIAEALRGDLGSGRWRAGDALPPVAELRSRFGAGEYAVRAALKMLRDDGLLLVRQGVGATATGKDTWHWRGRVAFVAVGVPGSYYSQMLAHQMSTRLADDGWDLVFISLHSCPSKSLDLTRVRRYVEAGLDFAVCYCSEREIIDVFADADVPYIVFDAGVKSDPRARAVVSLDFGECFSEVAAALKARGVRRLLEVDYDRRIDRSFKSQLLEAGISVHRLFGAWEKPGRWRVGEIREAGHRLVARYFRDARNRLHPPDAVLFDDDYFASGGVPAIVEAGLRIPEDIGVVAWSNAGNELAFDFSLARIENDPFEHGKALAEYLLKLLNGQRARSPRLFTRFIPGSSL